jgi:hypothetical protein
MRVARATGRVEPSRRHGPFDPRFRRGPIATENRVGRVRKTNQPASYDREEAHHARDVLELGTMQVWESEGGALQPSG